MEFKMKRYKQDEFDSLVADLSIRIKFGFGMISHDFDGEIMIAKVSDDFIEKLTESQLNELKSIG